MKELMEKRNAMLDELDGILAKATEEKRAFDDTEMARLTEVKEEIRKIDESIKMDEEVRKLEKTEVIKVEKTELELRNEVIEKEERAFATLISEGRAADLPASTNGSIIPVSIANKIVEQVKNLSPLLSEATMWNVKGSLNIPAYDWQNHTTAYQGAEFTAVTASAGVFTHITLQGYVIGSLALISKSLINRGDVNPVPFVVTQIAKSIANFIENELINQTAAGKMKGLKTIVAGQKVTSNTTLVIAPEELVAFKMKLQQAFQGNAKFLMHPETLAYLQGLKSTTGEFLLGNTLAQDGGFTLLGKPVMLSDNMDKIGVGKFQIFYGDFSGLHVKVEQTFDVQVLQEKYAEQHALGVVAFGSYDSAIVESQKILAFIGK
jgi:HK97 family phage major capsid protein